MRVTIWRKREGKRWVDAGGNRRPDVSETIFSAASRHKAVAHHLHQALHVEMLRGVYDTHTHTRTMHRDGNARKIADLRIKIVALLTRQIDRLGKIRERSQGRGDAEQTRVNYVEVRGSLSVNVDHRTNPTRERKLVKLVHCARVCARR